MTCMRSSFFACVFGDFFIAGTSSCSENVFGFFFGDRGQPLSLACSFFTFLLVTLSLPLGQPTLWISLVAFNELLDLLGKAYSFLLLYPLLVTGLLCDFLLHFIFFLGRNMHVLLNELQISDVSELFRSFNASESLFSFFHKALT
jgi:hypothetical protein